ncbi:hypothetical protein C8Q76DRAFT_246908 [Earliella scabrosa]|nr:hypothetical protein C8Q76DRAFT_246908 [Earliella scabrosa]
MSGSARLGTRGRSPTDSDRPWAETSLAHSFSSNGSSSPVTRSLFPSLTLSSAHREPLLNVVIVMSDAIPRIPKPPLQSNAIAYIAVRGLTFDNEGNDSDPLVVPRIEYDKVRRGTEDLETVISIHTLDYLPYDSAKTAPTSTQLQLGDDRITLRLQLGRRISRTTDHHLVYEVTPLNGEAFDIPALVLKVAKELDGRDVAEEAAMYTHLQPLQGVVIPRLYGYFNCYVNRLERIVTPWDGKHVSLPRTFDEFRMPNQLASLNMLLLERVGGRIPLKPLPEGLQQDLYEMTIDFLNYGVLYTDWRRSNIRFAPSSPPGLDGLPSPLYNRVYKYRFIDLEDARITARTPNHSMKLRREYCVQYFVKELEDRAQWVDYDDSDEDDSDEDDSDDDEEEDEDDEEDESENGDDDGNEDDDEDEEASEDPKA